MTWKDLRVAPKIGLTFGGLVLLSILVGAIAVRLGLDELHGYRGG